MIAFSGFRGDCVFNYCICRVRPARVHIYIIIRFKDCNLRKNSQFAIFRLSHLKPVLRYYQIEKKNIARLRWLVCCLHNCPQLLPEWDCWGPHTHTHTHKLTHTHTHAHTCIIYTYKWSRHAMCTVRAKLHVHTCRFNKMRQKCQWLQTALSCFSWEIFPVYMYVT